LRSLGVRQRGGMRKTSWIHIFLEYSHEHLPIAAKHPSKSLFFGWISYQCLGIAFLGWPSIQLIGLLCSDQQVCIKEWPHHQTPY